MTSPPGTTGPAGGILLRGLDGSNPLAFLAALGTLRVLDLANEDPFEPPRMWWVSANRVWLPILEMRIPGTAPGAETLLDSLEDSLLKNRDETPFAWADDPRVSRPVFRKFLTKVVADLDRPRRRVADFAAAIASDACIDDKGRVLDTALRAVGGGKQRFLTFIRNLLRDTSREQIREALFGPWRYEDKGDELRWDPLADRRYAFRWHDPSGEKPRSVRGANRLAVEALPLMPTAPRGSRLLTTGFNGLTWTWPIWEWPADAAVVRSLLTHPALRAGGAGRPDLPALREVGVAEVFRSSRIKVRNYRNFTPVVPAS